MHDYDVDKIDKIRHSIDFEYTYIRKSRENKI